MTLSTKGVGHFSAAEKKYLPCCNKEGSSVILSLFKWCHQESNRGHKDFQSFALPTELWHHRFS